MSFSLDLMDDDIVHNGVTRVVGREYSVHQKL